MSYNANYKNPQHYDAWEERRSRVGGSHRASHPRPFHHDKYDDDNHNNAFHPPVHRLDLSQSSSQPMSQLTQSQSQSQSQGGLALYSQSPSQQSQRSVLHPTEATAIDQWWSREQERQHRQDTSEASSQQQMVLEESRDRRPREPHAYPSQRYDNDNDDESGWQTTNKRRQSLLDDKGDDCPSIHQQQQQHLCAQEASQTSTSDEEVDHSRKQRRTLRTSLRKNANATTTPEMLSSEDVIRRMERLAQSVVKALANDELPELTTLTMDAFVRSNKNDSDSENDSESEEEEDDDDDKDDGSDDDNGGTTMRILRNTHPSNEQVLPHRRIVFHNLSQSRKFSSILLVLSFCHALLLAQRTTTTREVYYFYVTHFRTQRECDDAITDVTTLLRVPRSSLGLFASPKGWYCGCIQILHPQTGRVVMDGQALSSVQGAPITQEWLQSKQQRDFDIDCRVVPRSSSASANVDDSRSQGPHDDDSKGAPPPPQLRAKCILVIEKEGVYNRLSEDRLYERYPCILVTGKGFPDLATRSLVYTLHHELNLPVYGIADCNPYGVLVLQTYQYGSLSRGVDGGSRYSVPIQWLGLRPSHVEKFVAGSKNDNSQFSSNTTPTATLPPAVFQQLTELDEKRLEQLLGEGHKFHADAGASSGDRYEELEVMKENGYKVELEALNWLGMDYLANWVLGILHRHDEQKQKQSRARARKRTRFDDSEDEEGSQDQFLEDDDEDDNGTESLPAII